MAATEILVATAVVIFAAVEVQGSTVMAKVRIGATVTKTLGAAPASVGRVGQTRG